MKSAMVLTTGKSAHLTRWHTPDSTRVVASTELRGEVFLVGMRFIALVRQWWRRQCLYVKLSASVTGVQAVFGFMGVHVGHIRIHSS